MLTHGRAEELGFEIANESTCDDPLKYSLRLRPHGLGYEIAEETLGGHPLGVLAHVLSFGRDISYLDPEKLGMVRPTWEHNPLETSLAQIPKMFQDTEDFRRRLASSTFSHVLNVDPRSPVRLPEPMAPAELPGRNGEDLVSCLFNLRETNRDRFEAIGDSLRAAFPKFERLDFPPVAAGTLALAWREKGFSKPLYSHQLSEGTPTTSSIPTRRSTISKRGCFPSGRTSSGWRTAIEPRRAASRKLPQVILEAA